MARSNKGPNKGKKAPIKQRYLNKEASMKLDKPTPIPKVGNPILMMGKIVFPTAAKNYLKKVKPVAKKIVKKKVASKPAPGPSNKELIQVEIDPIGDREW